MKRWEIYLEILIELILIVGTMFAIGYLLPKTLAFLWPLVAGWIIAVIAHPMHKFLQKRLKVSKKFGSAFIVILLIALVSGLIYQITAKLVNESMGFIHTVPAIYQEVQNNVTSLWMSVKDWLPDSIGDKVTNVVNSLASEVSGYMTSDKGAEYIGNVAHRLTNGVIGIIVMFMSAYFFIADWDKIHKGLYDLMSEEVKVRFTAIKDNMLGAVGGYFLAQLKLMGIVGVLLFIGLMIMRIDYALILALLIAILDALPFFGVGTALVPWSIYAFIAGDFNQGIGLLVIYGVCLILRQVLQPKMVGESVGLGALETLVLMYIGMKVAGIIGFIIAVVLGIIVKRLYELGMFDGSIKRMQVRFEMLKDAE